jgi:DNA-binding NarL/FixJ family response regulator
VPSERTTKAPERTIRILLVEQHALVRALLREIVNVEPDLQIVGEAVDIDAAIDVIKDDPPDVILVDTERSISSVITSIQRLRREFPGSPVVVLGHRRGDDELFGAIQAGAAAHVLSDARPTELVRTIREVAEGHYLIDDTVAARPAVARRVLEAFRESALVGRPPDGEPSGRAFAPLSPRETEILTAIAQGMSNKDIAAELSISVQTVNNHIKSVLRKLAVNNRTQAVLFALRRSWISLPDLPPNRPH